MFLFKLIKLDADPAPISRGGASEPPRKNHSIKDEKERYFRSQLYNLFGIDRNADLNDVSKLFKNNLDELKQFKQKDLTENQKVIAALKDENEKLKKDADEYKKASTEYYKQLEELVIEKNIGEWATKEGSINSSQVIKLLKHDIKSQLKEDEDITTFDFKAPAVQKQLTEFKTANSNLFSTVKNPYSSGVPGSGATTGNTSSFTLEQINDMSIEEYQKNRDSIHGALKEGKIVSNKG